MSKHAPVTTRRPAWPPVLQVSQLRVRRGRTTILREINWRVNRREHWVILGANGSGKTSLLSALTGYLMPTSGTISVLGETYGETDWRELRKRIGLVSSALRQRMADTEPALESVVGGRYAMIDFWGQPTPADRRAARHWLRQVGGARLADRPWGVLSQGERQRILIARALMARPALLILDEPCAGLDPTARERFLQFLQRLGRQPGAPALVLVTHHVEEIMPVFSHVLLLHRGGVLAAGRKPAVLTRPALAEAFGVPVRLTRYAGRWHLQVRPPRRLVV